MAVKLGTSQVSLELYWKGDKTYPNNGRLSIKMRLDGIRYYINTMNEGLCSLLELKSMSEIEKLTGSIDFQEKIEFEATVMKISSKVVQMPGFRGARVSESSFDEKNISVTIQKCSEIVADQIYQIKIERVDNDITATIERK